ncbi:hypothetical protein P389DRAFT_175042 [Cystobasidium minutum MCA 4210]|uniref:uncharacterized protein n=1 Tax=Cystobasidium minutum MCA 4210 TaxID=1397322 RepID=UPI0034CFB8DB|eukprot:jgi/Rhomi1/175042/fgenesh1_kg.9_\
MDSAHAAMSPVPQASRPQSVGPMCQPFPIHSTPQAPEAWQLPSPSLRSRSAVSSPGPSSQKPRRYSGSHRARGLLNKVHDAVRSIHEVARAVTPLKQRVSETQDVLTQQYNELHHRVDDVSQKHLTLERNVNRRLSNAEANIEDLKGEDLARRAQSVPPQRYNAANMSQDELLERSIMLYGVWALERRLAS